MKSWWFSLQPRERYTLAGGALMLLVTLLYVGLWEPLQLGYERLERRVESQQQTIAEMERAAREVARLRAQGSGPQADRGGQSLMTLIDTSARSAGMAEALERVQPENNGKVRVWFDNASFDAMLGWLDSLIGRYGVVVDSLVVERGEGEGRVDVRAVLGDAP